MFSPAAKKSNAGARKDRNLGRAPHDSPVTPLAENQRAIQDNSIQNRPATGTPAPWASRLSVLARIPPVSNDGKGNKGDPVRPVYIGEFPQVVRDEQALFLQKRVPDDPYVSGGMDKETSFAWIICGNKLFIWNYLSSAASRKCVVLDLPESGLENPNVRSNSHHGNCWLLCVVNWEKSSRNTNTVVLQSNSAGIVLCNQKTRAVFYWPDIFTEGGTTPVSSLVSVDESELNFSPSDAKHTPNKLRQRGRTGDSLVVSPSFNSLIASAAHNTRKTCIAIACSSNGELWQFHCSVTCIKRKRILQDTLSTSSQSNEGSQLIGSKGYPRSLIWRFSQFSFEERSRQFFLLTDHEIQCFAIVLSSEFNVSKLWTHEIIGTDADSGIKKDLAGQKRIWPLDMQVDNHGKVMTILVATFCKDRVSGSSYTQYSLLKMQYKSGLGTSSEFNAPTQDKILEKKAPIQVIIPKARVEEEDFLFSMSLRIGGKPSGSAVILSGDGTATVSHYWRDATRLYQFDLPYDAGKVLDASVFISSDDGEDGAWAVLTEKAGIWAIPEKAVLLGGVEPPERSLSRKGSSNEGSAREEKRNFSFTGDIASKKASSKTGEAGDRQRAVFTGVARRSAYDEESEALLNNLFHEFLLSEQVDGSFDKLTKSGAFERDGDTNVFARVSKSIVDTFAKHWTTTRGAEIVAMTVVSTQLMDKQQKHQRFLQFLALSKCHAELYTKQRQSLHIIMEHGEKLAGMIQLKELQNTISQNRSTGHGSLTPALENEISGPLWDLIQLVGERARRNTILLMDRDNTEVFYSKVSELEQVFYCLDGQLEFIISSEMPLVVQIQRACELSNACVTLIRSAMHYRNEHHMWYPSPEGLTPWCCQSVVRSGLWGIASFMIQLLNEVSCLDVSTKSDLHRHLEILAEVLLEACSGAITAKIERGEEHKGLLDEYSNRRDVLLGSLYQHVKSSVGARYQDPSEETEEQNEVIYRKLSSHLLSIAQRHEGYQTLWNICCDLNDIELLRKLMRDSMGPKKGFSHFVFKQMYEKKQLSKLLRLGEEFQDELASFVKQHQDIAWFHELFLHQFASASETLHVLALSQDESSSASAEEGTDSYVANAEPTLVERRRLLNLSKIAALAGQNDDYKTKLKRIEADLKILKVQEEIIQLIRDNEEKQRIGLRLLSPVHLIKLCLKDQSRELSLWAFDVFAWTSSSFIKCHRSLLEECWRNVANQDEWGEIYRTSMAEGWSDEEMLRVLRETMLSKASSRCYGSEAESFEGGFNELLPPRVENSELAASSMDTHSSVEAIIMQHKDFPEAGKLMLTAVMLGITDAVEVPMLMQ